MKFYCDNCQTKYSIGDDKVRGKVLKIRCKKCSHIITVREPQAPVQPGPSSVSAASPPKAAAPPPPPPKRTVVEWHYAINGQSFGPLSEKALQSKFASGELGDAVYVWNESFVEWKPASTEAAFAAALSEGKKTRKPNRTLGVSAPLEALDRAAVEAEEARLRALAAPEPAPEVEPEAKPESRPEPKLKQKSRPKPRGAAPEDSQQARLQALRDRLKLDEEEEGDVSISEPGLGLVEESEKPEAESVKRMTMTLSEDAEIAFAETLSDGDAGSESAGSDAEVHDGLFSGLDSGVMSAQEALESQQGEEEDEVPFFASAPKLGGENQPSSMSRADEVTGSLLIQLNAIKSDGRKRAIFTVLASLVTVVLVGAVGYYGFTQRGTEVEEEVRPRIRADHVGQTPEFRAYTEEERRRGLEQIVVTSEALVVSREDSRAAYAEEERVRRSSGSATEQAEQPRRTAPRIDPSAFRLADEGEVTRASDDQQAGTSSRFQRTGLAGAGEGSAIGGTAGNVGIAGSAEEFDDERLQAMARLQTDTQRGVYNPRDEFDELVGVRDRLSSGDIAQGMQNVMASVGACRERHILRGGTLEHDRVEVTLNIATSGRVEEMTLSPAALRDTDFGRCMNSHTRRWRFPPFRGEAMQVRTPFLLQD